MVKKLDIKRSSIKASEELYRKAKQLKKDAYGDIDKYKGAIKAYESVVATNPNHAKAYFALGDLTCGILLKYATSVLFFIKAIKIDQHYLDAYRNLTVSLWWLSEQNPLGKHIQLQQEKDLYWEAWEMVMLKKYHEAIKKLQEALKVNNGLCGRSAKIVGSLPNL